MPPINPSALNKKSYTVTSSDLLNSVIIDDFSPTLFICSLKDSGGYDGAVKLQYEGEDGSWNDIVSNTGGDKNNFADQMSADSGIWVNTLGASRTKFPMHIRSQVTFKATTGQCLVEIDYI